MRLIPIDNEDPRFEDIEILKAFKAGNQDAFVWLLRKYEVRVRGYCMQMLRSRDAADDAAQEVFLKAYKALGKFRGESKLSTWLYRISANHCLDICRKNRLKRMLSLDSVGDKGKMLESRVVQSEDNTFSAFAAKESIQKILSALPPASRSVLILREIHGLSYQELADTLKCSLDAVKSRLKRARRQALAINQKLEYESGDFKL